MSVYELIANEMNPKYNTFQFIYHMRHITFNHIERGVTETVNSRLNNIIDEDYTIYHDSDFPFMEYGRFVGTRISSYKNFIRTKLISYSYETKTGGSVTLVEFTKQ